MPIIDYIERQEEAKRPPIMLVYDSIKMVLPDAKERISYGMPTLWRGGNLIHFAAMKNHIGLYPGPMPSMRSPRNFVPIRQAPARSLPA
ncbi:MAG: hypothetical protein SPL80_02520 [Bacilli bacterium]|nr:hypothetical protein [Bacilli bacterium]